MEYKAAGILPVSMHDGVVYVLLGNEPCREGMRWLAFGGKREPIDKDAIATAQREFAEESGGYLPAPELLDATFYDRQAKFVLHIGWLPFEQTLPSFTDEEAAKNPTLNKRSIQWFKLEELLSESRFSPMGEEPMKQWFYSFVNRNRFLIRRAIQESHQFKAGTFKEG